MRSQILRSYFPRPQGGSGPSIGEQRKEGVGEFTQSPGLHSHHTGPGRGEVPLLGCVPQAYPASEHQHWALTRPHRSFLPTLPSVQSLSRVQLCNPVNYSMPGLQSITNSWSPPKPMSIESVMPSSHLILCCPLFSCSNFLSIRVFSNESALCIRWPKYWSFSFNISPFNEYPGLISLRMDWFDLLAVQGTLKSLLQHHSSEASILRRSAFFIVQLSHPYMTTGKTIALTRRTFVGKVMSAS